MAPDCKTRLSEGPDFVRLRSGKFAALGNLEIMDASSKALLALGDPCKCGNIGVGGRDGLRFGVEGGVAWSFAGSSLSPRST